MVSIDTMVDYRPRYTDQLLRAPLFAAMPAKVVINLSVGFETTASTPMKTPATIRVKSGAMSAPKDQSIVAAFYQPNLEMYIPERPTPPGSFTAMPTWKCRASY